MGRRDIESGIFLRHNIYKDEDETIHWVFHCEYSCEGVAFQNSPKLETEHMVFVRRIAHLQIIKQKRQNVGYSIGSIV
jgi:hypothetical protein